MESMDIQVKENLIVTSFDSATSVNKTVKQLKLKDCGCDGTGNTVKGRKTHTTL